MLTQLVICLLFTTSIEAQLNGEFWWLNSKVSEFHGKTIPPPKFEELTEFDTDETLIVFNDNNFSSMKHGVVSDPKTVRQFKMRPDRLQTKRKKIVNVDDKIVFGPIKKQDNNKIVWPSNDGIKKSFNIGTSTNRFIHNEQTTKLSITQSTTQDQFAIKFPERDFFYVPDPTSKVITSTPVYNAETTATAVDAITTTVNNITEPIFFDHTDSFTERKKSICTYIRKQDCMKYNGFIYAAEYGKSVRIGPKDPNLICCVLPVPIKKEVTKPSEDHNSNTQFYFPEKNSPHERYKRSDDELRQRNVLLQHKRAQERRTKPVATETKIVTAEEEEEDPYWNIKNSKFQQTRKPLKAIAYDYKDDYVQEYTDEVPRPGLIGIYSENGRRPVSWNVKKREQSYGEDADYDDVEDSGTSFGYGTIDPRQDNKKTKKRKQPIKITATTEKKYDPESQIITFQSNPNFEVLQGFKLLNLARDKNKMSKRTTDQTNVSSDSDDEETVMSTITTSPRSINSFKENLQLFSGCGQTSTPTKLKQKDVQIGDAEQGSHTWLIVVTPANDPDDILCYGTLIHPRAAITAADCVNDIPPEGITVIAGLWKLSEKTTSRRRTPAVHLHPKFRPGSIAHNLAILTWTHPFKLCDEIQTACLAEPRQGKDCMMYGWGGFDQALRQRSRWQRARMHECKQIPSGRNTNGANNAFCASVQSRGTVSGVGGPFICNVNGRDALVGVAISRDTKVVFLPAKDWAMQAQEFITED